MSPSSIPDKADARLVSLSNGYHTLGADDHIDYLLSLDPDEYDNIDEAIEDWSERDGA